MIEYACGYTQTKFNIDILKNLVKNSFGDIGIFINKLSMLLYKDIHKGFVDWFDTKERAESRVINKDRIKVSDNNKYVIIGGTLTVQCINDRTFRVVNCYINEDKIKQLMQILNEEQTT